MSSEKKRCRVVLLGLLIFGMISAASASNHPDISINSQDNVIWLNQGTQDQTVNFQTSCGNTTAIDDVFVWDGQQSYNPTNTSSGWEFNVGARNLPVGEYQLVTSCQDGNQEETKFEIDRLKLEISKLKETLFVGDSFSTEVRVTSELGNLQLSKMSYPRLYLKSESTNYQLFGEQKIKDDKMTVEADSIPEDFISGTEENGKVRVNLEYEQTRSDGLNYEIPLETKQGVDISRWDIKSVIEPSKRVLNDDLENVKIDLKIRYEGEPVTAPEDNDYSGKFYLDGDNVDPSENENSGVYSWFSGGYQGESDDGKYGKYTIELGSVPQLPEGFHDLEVYFDSQNGDKKVADFTVQNQFRFAGQVRDSNSRLVDAKFTLDFGNSQRVFSTEGPNKRFSETFAPGKYGLGVEFPKGSVSLQDVEFERNYTGAVKYDYFEDPSTLGLDGVKPVNLMTTMFIYPFDQASAKMQFDSEKPDDPSKVDVFECTRWNFKQRNCVSSQGWEKIEEGVRISTTSNGEWVADFPVTPVETDEYTSTKNVLRGAYVVGTDSKLEIPSLALDSYRLSQGSDLTATGTVTSDKGPVGDADVTFSLVKNNEFVKNVSGNTDAGGEFSLKMETPEAANYTMHVSASKDPFTSYSDSINEEVWIYQKKDINMEIPSRVQIVPGEMKEAELKITNDGQTDFTDIELELDRPDIGSYNFSEEKIDSLGAGESVTVKMSLKVPEDYLQVSSQQYREIPITLSGESGGKQISKDYELLAQVTTTSSPGGQQESSSESETDETSSQPDNTGNSLTGLFSEKVEEPTGEFLASQSSLNIALGLIMVFTLALAGAIKKKKGEGDDSTERARIMPQKPGGSNIQKPEVTPVQVEKAGSGTQTNEEHIDQIAEAMQDHVPDNVEDEEDIDKIAQELSRKEEGEVSEEPSVNGGSETKHDDEWMEKLKNQEDVDSEAVKGIAVEEDAYDKESDKWICGETGEEFDTKSALKLHKKINGIE